MLFEVVSDASSLIFFSKDEPTSAGTVFAVSALARGTGICSEKGLFSTPFVAMVRRKRRP